MRPCTYMLSCTGGGGGRLGRGVGGGVRGWWNREGGEGGLRALADALEVVAGADTMGMTCAAGAPGGGGAAGAPGPTQALRQHVCS